MSQDLSRFRLRQRLVDPSLNRVTSGDQTVQVEPKIMQVLVALAERPGQLVSRDELMARVWPGVFVTDDVLHRAIRELRRLFDGEAAEKDSASIIETIRKRGYRLVAEIDRSDPDGGRTAPTPADTRSAVGRSSHGWIPGAGTIAAVLIAAALAAVAIAQLGVGRSGTVNTEARVRFTPFTSEPGNEVDPALSSSGQLAYVARGADGRAHIFTKRAPDARPVQITEGADREYAPVWSPDETEIAFVQSGGRGCTIRIAAADGSRARDLVPCGSRDELRMSWSPDGASLAMTAGAATLASPAHIEIVTIATGARRAATTPPLAHLGDSSPAFSPDGRQIAFVRSISGAIGDLFVAPLSGGPAARVTVDNADVLGVDWEPDGRHLVFSSDRNGGISLWRVPVNGGEPMLLAGGGAKLKHPTIARRSGTVAYEDWHYEINLVEADTGAGRPGRAGQAGGEEGAAGAGGAGRGDSAGGGWTPLSPTSDRWNFHPQISPDGRRLAFQSTRSGQYEIWVADRSGGDARQLTRSATYKSLPRWSADGHRLVFAARRATSSELVVLDVDAGTARTIMSDAASAVAPSWSLDNQHVYFGSPRSGAWQIWSVDVASGQTRQVTSDGGYAALESFDGRWLYYTRLDRPGLLRRRSSAGLDVPTVDEMIVADLRPEEWPNWGVLDRGVFFLAHPDDGDPQLAMVDGPAARPRLLTRLADFAWTGVAVSRDGARAIWAHADRRDANIGSIELRIKNQEFGIRPTNP